MGGAVPPAGSLPSTLQKEATQTAWQLKGGLVAGRERRVTAGIVVTPCG